MFEKEAEIEFQKLPITEREKLISVVQVWNKAFVSGANFCFQKCAKSRLNITTISDRPVEGIIEELQAQIEKMKCCYNCANDTLEPPEVIGNGICEHCKNHDKWELGY